MTGLENTIAAQTRLGFIDGERGELWIQGHPVSQWIQQDYLEAANALLKRSDRAEDFQNARQQAQEWLQPHLATLNPMAPLEALKTAYAMLSEPDALLVLALGQVLLPSVLRTRGHQPAVKKPQITLDPVADFLHNLYDRPPTPSEHEALKTYWLTVSEHGLNASTFTCRVIASTGSDLGSALAGAIGALKGPLHGGAPAPVLKMLDALEQVDSIERWVKEALEKQERIMGFGHRVYRNRDPRAAVLENAVDQLQQSPRLAFARQAEKEIVNTLKAAKPGRVILTNVEFYTALLLEALGFTPEAFTGVFALGRTLGWVAHYQEQQASGRLIRPRAEYIGPALAV